METNINSRWNESIHCGLCSYQLSYGYPKTPRSSWLLAEIIPVVWNWSMEWAYEQIRITATIRVGQKCKRWPPWVVFHQLETSVNNDFVIYKATQAGKRLTSKEFRMTLATHLMSGYVANDNIPVGWRRVHANLEPRLQNVGPHIPVIVPSRVCAVCSARLSHQYSNEKRPRPARSIIRCETCDLHLCLNSNSNCFSVWHKQQKFFYFSMVFYWEKRF